MGRYQVVFSDVLFVSIMVLLLEMQRLLYIMVYDIQTYLANLFKSDAPMIQIHGMDL
jgi:hypothetical protein